MSRQFHLILFSVLFGCVRAQENNQLCPCDTESDQKDNLDLWNFLKKLSGDVSKENQELYAVPPGNLFQFDCSRCDEKLRKKRRIMLEDEPDMPVEAVKNNKAVADDEVRDKRYVMDTKSRLVDLRCPEGTYRFLRTCVSIDDFEDESDV